MHQIKFQESPHKDYIRLITREDAFLWGFKERIGGIGFQY